jgi:hypothetical protein
MIRSEAARNFRLRLSRHRVVQVLLQRPLPDVGDLRVVNLNFVVNLVGGQSGLAHDHGDYGRD